MSPFIASLDDIGLNDIKHYGGKNASLGEMRRHLSQSGLRVPGGFATSSEAYRLFLEKNNLSATLKKHLEHLNVEDLSALAKAGKATRDAMLAAALPAELESAVREAYAHLKKAKPHLTVAVRSSATAEDLPDASFAGQQETFLNVETIEDVLQKIRHVYASVFTDRAIAYRAHHQFSHFDLAMSVGIQQMVRSDIGASGVMFTLDTESGFDQVVFITSSYGLGELVVQGAVNPDEFYVDKRMLQQNKHAIVRRHLGSKLQKMVYGDTDAIRVQTLPVEATLQHQFSLNDEEVETLAKEALKIEAHYGRPMDIEWGKDGEDGQLYILQARPETVQSRAATHQIERITLLEKGEILSEGRAIGQKLGQGVARVVKSLDDIHEIKAGEVLITDMTDPDWEPIMKRAAAIVTNRGGRTCHAAIIARELGIPAVVGCGNATQKIKSGSEVTVSCAEGDTGFIYSGKLKYQTNVITLNNMPALPFKMMMNVGNPELAFGFQSIPNEGIGLARLEFVINRWVGVHPQACLQFDTLAPELKEKIQKVIHGYPNPVDYYVMRLSEAISTLASAFYPKKVIVRLSDFKTNEYANLLGGQGFEPHEENPMIGYRGASRYISQDFKACFALECEAIKHVRNKMGFTNVEIMIPFVRTVHEAKEVIKVLEACGLKRGENGLRVIMMCEVPSNAILADQFLDLFDGFSIGSNDLTQLTLGLDRDSGIVAGEFDERNEAVKHLIHLAIQACKRRGKYIGICGQGPSDHADFAKWLMDEGIESVSLNPDSVLDTWLYLAKGLN